MFKSANWWKEPDSVLTQELADRGLALENFSRKEAIALIKMHDSKKMVMLDENDDLKEDPLKDTPRLELVRVIFHAQSEHSLPYVPVGHNGRAFYIPVEIEVDVPKYILNSCIKDAVEDRTYSEVGSDGKINWKVRKVQRFPYTIVQA